MISMVGSFLNTLAEKNEEFRNSSFYTEMKMFDNHDVIYCKNATNYLSWIHSVYGDKWTEHIGNMIYEEVDGEMIIYVPDKDGNILAR
jgi:hypothetical protein